MIDLETDSPDPSSSPEPQAGGSRWSWRGPPALDAGQSMSPAADRPAGGHLGLSRATRLTEGLGSLARIANVDGGVDGCRATEHRTCQAGVAASATSVSGAVDGWSATRPRLTRLSVAARPANVAGDADGFWATIRTSSVVPEAAI